MKKFTQTSNKFKVKIYCLLITLMMSITGFSQNVGINSTGTPPNASAGLDVDFPDKGLLIPRVILTGILLPNPLSAHVAGMIVYNTAGGSVAPGFYYNNGIKWVSGFPSGNAIGNMLYWDGNAWVLLPAGTAGQFLQLTAANIPAWAGAAFATLITTTTTAITAVSATSGGTITNDGGSAVLYSGLCWNTLTGPTVANSKTQDVAVAGVFTSNLTGLLPGTNYFVRAYSANSNVISYGNEVTFATLAELPTIAATEAITAITATSATSGGNITSNGGAAISARGICYGTLSGPSITLLTNTTLVDPTPAIGVYTGIMTPLLTSTTYYVRSYATNSAGTSYGTEVSFKTPVSLTTTAATLIGGTIATAGGVLTADGPVANLTNLAIAYSTISNDPAPLMKWNPIQYPTTSVTYSADLTGLTPNTIYYIRAYADGAGITIYGPELTFTTTAATAATVPVISATTAAIVISANQIQTGGTITSDGQASITDAGVCWSLTPTATLGVGNFTIDGAHFATSYSSNIYGLLPGTTYYVRAYATNSAGTGYGPEVMFTNAALTIGMAYQGGTIAYILQSGDPGYVASVQHGIIGSSINGLGSKIWSNTGAVTGATGTAIGTGMANTIAIVAAGGIGTAAEFCSNLVDGGYSDWYLPSQDELNKLYLVRGLFNMNSQWFWSSTETSQYNALYMKFTSTIGIVPSEGKTIIHSCRAIRSF